MPEESIRFNRVTVSFAAAVVRARNEKVQFVRLDPSSDHGVKNATFFKSTEELTSHFQNSDTYLGNSQIIDLRGGAVIRVGAIEAAYKINTQAEFPSFREGVTCQV